MKKFYKFTLWAATFFNVILILTWLVSWSGQFDLWLIKIFGNEYITDPILKIFSIAAFFSALTSVKISHKYHITEWSRLAKINLLFVSVFILFQLFIVGFVYILYGGYYLGYWR